MITVLLHVKEAHTGGQLRLSRVRLSRPHTESTALISQRHQVEIKDILFTLNFKIRLAIFVHLQKIT